DLLLGDGHRLSIEAYQAGDAYRCQYLDLLLECKVAKEIARKQGQLNHSHAIGPAAPLLPQGLEGYNRLGSQLVTHALLTPGARLNSVPAWMRERVDGHEALPFGSDIHVMLQLSLSCSSK